jgi:hypothetical protein
MILQSLHLLNTARIATHSNTYLPCYPGASAVLLLRLLQLEDVEVSGSDYIRPLLLGNFRGSWEQLDQGSEREDDYGLGHRENLQVRFLAEAVQL